MPTVRGVWHRPWSYLPLGRLFRSPFSSSSRNPRFTPSPLRGSNNTNNLRHNLLSMRTTRTTKHFESTNSKPSPKPNNNSSSTSSASSASSSETAHRTRLSKILSSALRWTPRRLRPYGERLRSAPLSHVVAFLVLHEFTAIAPLLGLVALFKWAGWVPTAVVLGPWAEWAQEGLKKYGAYFRRKGWFGLREGDDVAGEEALEGRLDEEVVSMKRRERQREEETLGEEGEMNSSNSSSSKKAWRKVKEVVTLGNLESGYNTGIQIAAA